MKALGTWSAVILIVYATLAGLFTLLSIAGGMTGHIHFRVEDGSGDVAVSFQSSALLG